MLKKINTILLALIFLFGLGIMMYPTISNYYNEKIGSYLVASYESDISDISKDKSDLILNNARIYNSNLLSKQACFINGNVKDKDYMSQLKISEEDSIIGYIEIDRIKLKLPIFKGTSEPVLQKGVGHLEGSSLPIGGVGTHSILTGHRGLPSAKLFTNLDKLELKDIIVIKVLNRVLTYEVENIEVVEPEEIDSLKIDKDKDLLTLVTCTPYGVNSHRLLIHAKRVENIVEAEHKISEYTIDKDYTRMIVLSIVMVVSVIILIYKNNRNKKN